MSKYYVCCQHKELNSLSHHNCYLLASVADYDGVTLMSEMMMLVMMAIIITLAITAVAMSRKTLEAFFFFLRIFIVWIQKPDSFAPISPPTLRRIPAVMDVSQASTSHWSALDIKPGLLL